LMVIHTSWIVASDRVAVSFHVPTLRDLVLKLKCHSPDAASVRRNWLPVVAESVGVASITGSESTELEYFVACSVCTPVAIGVPPQPARNLTGIVLPSLNALRGSEKLPPVPRATSPPIGERNPVKPSGARVTVNEQVLLLLEASTAVHKTGVAPTGKLALPEAGAQVTVGCGSQVSLPVGAG